MTRHLIWTPWEGPGAEHLHLAATDGGAIADGLVVGLAHGLPLRVLYRVASDKSWATRLVRVALLDGSGAELALNADGAGHWHDATGTSVALLSGCLDVDLGVTPYTNTLAIRRLALKPGKSTEIDAVSIEPIKLADDPEGDEPRLGLRIRRARQRYTCLDVGQSGASYRYESLASGFAATISVDADGLVIEYPGAWVRVWSR